MLCLLVMWWTFGYAYQTCPKTGVFINSTFSFVGEWTPLSKIDSYSMMLDDGFWMIYTLDLCGNCLPSYIFSPLFSVQFGQLQTFGPTELDIQVMFPAPATPPYGYQLVVSNSPFMDCSGVEVNYLNLVYPSQWLTDINMSPNDVLSFVNQPPVNFHIDLTRRDFGKDYYVQIYQNYQQEWDEWTEMKCGPISVGCVIDRVELIVDGVSSIVWTEEGVSGFPKVGTIPISEFIPGYLFADCPIFVVPATLSQETNLTLNVKIPESYNILFLPVKWIGIIMYEPPSFGGLGPGYAQGEKNTLTNNYKIGAEPVYTPCTIVYGVLDPYDVDYYTIHLFSTDILSVSLGLVCDGKRFGFDIEPSTSNISSDCSVTLTGFASNNYYFKLSSFTTLTAAYTLKLCQVGEVYYYFRSIHTVLPVTAIFYVPWLVGSFGEERQVFPQLKAPFHVEFGWIDAGVTQSFIIDLSSIYIPDFAIGSGFALHSWKISVLSGKCLLSCSFYGTFNVSVLFEDGSAFHLMDESCPRVLQIDNSIVQNSRHAILNLTTNVPGFYAIEMVPLELVQVLCSRQGEILSIPSTVLNQSVSNEIPNIAPVLVQGYLNEGQSHTWKIQFQFSSEWSFSIKPTSTIVEVYDPVARSFSLLHVWRKIKPPLRPQDHTNYVQCQYQRQHQRHLQHQYQYPDTCPNANAIPIPMPNHKIPIRDTEATQILAR
eukprot:TRINITY_DN10295_c0_g4_i2.p1 TRINITY_DN10295_c0_g4~~TRINITY_DN10295_c0_g4_i2.p1  ORF type:complete len:709 (-),score=79.77 TRINITY_DN10295_c0_g4_i2:72-2198(-)